MRSVYADEMAHTDAVSLTSVPLVPVTRSYSKCRSAGKDFHGYALFFLQMRAALRGLDKSNTFKLNKERLYEEARRKTALMLGDKSKSGTGGKTVASKA
jgi:hypothetical protein